MAKPYNLDAAIRKVPDFPKKGILFYDVTGILAKPEAFAYCIDAMADLYTSASINAVAAIEARGFLFAAPLAIRLSLPIILIRKKGKLPNKTLRKSFALEYGEDSIEVQPIDVPKNGKILLIDDLIATGGTLKAAAELIAEAGGTVKEIFGIVGLPFLHYEEKLSGFKVTTLINYHGESVLDQ